jgi:hypothetical protein
MFWVLDLEDLLGGWRWHRWGCGRITWWSG